MLLKAPAFILILLQLHFSFRQTLKGKTLAMDGNIQLTAFLLSDDFWL